MQALIFAVLLATSAAKQFTKSKIPLLDRFRAPLFAELDMDNVFKQLQDYIETEINIRVNETFRQGMETNVGVKSPVISGGATYIQWGRSTCTHREAELVYSGYVGGTAYTTKGAAVNKLCLPKKPQWGIHDGKVNDSPSVGGTVFSLHDIHIANTLFDQKYTFYRIECSVCYIKHGSSTMMIPGRQECFSDWKKEYTGYLFAGYPGHGADSEYLCMDGKPDHLKKTSATWTGKAILYSVRASCNGALPCPPYVDGREMTCVVCSK